MNRDTKRSFIRTQIEHWAVKAPKRIAFSDNSGRVVNYENLLEKSNDLRSRWLKLGLTESAPVLIYLPRSSSKACYIASLLSANFPGIVLNMKTPMTELVKILKEYPVRAFISESSIGKTILSKSPQSKIIGEIEDESGISSFILGPKSNPSLESELLSTAWFLQTSGSTGRPKMVKLSWQNLLARTLGEIELFKISENDLLLNCLSASHDLGLNQILTSLYAGAQLRIECMAMPQDLARHLEQGDVRGITGTPLLWTSGLLHVKNESSLPYEYAGYLTISGGQMSEANLLKFVNLFPKARIIKTYGQTETFRTFSEVRPGKILGSSSGRVVSNVEAVLLNDSRELCKAGEIGELLHFGDGVMDGYFGDEVLSNQKLVEPTGLRFPLNKPGKGVLTGDYFFRDADNEYHFVGRRDDMIKRLDHRIYLSEIQNKIASSGLVKDAFVSVHKGVNAYGLEGCLVAWIVVDPVKGYSEKEIRQFCKMNLDKYKIPDKFITIDEFPRTATEKIDRQRLIDFYHEMNQS